MNPTIHVVARLILAGITLGFVTLSHAPVAAVDNSDSVTCPSGHDTTSEPGMGPYGEAITICCDDKGAEHANS